MNAQPVIYTSGVRDLELLARWLLEIDEEVEEMRAETRCQRCSTPAPPSARWAGDAWARDHRPPHTCVKSRWVK